MKDAGSSIGMAEGICEIIGYRSGLRLAPLHDPVESLPRLPSHDRHLGTICHAVLANAACAIDGRPTDSGGVRLGGGRRGTDRPCPRGTTRDQRDLD